MPEAIASFAAEYFAADAISVYLAADAVVSTIGTIALNAAISTVANKVLGGSSGQGGTAGPQLINNTIRQATASRRLIYGTVKTGGILVYPAQSPDAQNVWVDIYLGEGPIQGFSSTYWLGEDLSTDPKFAGLLYAEFQTGAPGQTPSVELMTASNGEWTPAHVGHGIAHAMVRMGHSRNAFPRGRMAVLPVFEVQGRLVYDPRAEGTLLANAYSNNPALCLLDFIRSQWGPDGGIADDLIDFDSFAAAAAVCDELVDSIDPANVVNGVPGKVRRYTLDGLFEVTGGHTAIVTTMLAAMAGALVPPGEKYRLYAGAWRAPTGPELTAEYLRADPTFRTHPARQQRINTVRGKYREPRQDWQEIDFYEQQDEAAVAAEDGEIVQTVNFPATTNGAIAQRLARLAMQRSRAQVPLALQCNWAAFQWSLWDVVPVNLPQVGAVGPHLITSYVWAEGGGIDLVLVPFTADQFAWDQATMERTVPVVVAPNFNTTPPAIAGLVVTGGGVVDAGPDVVAYGLTASWTATPDARFKHYEVQWAPAGSGAWSGENVTKPSWQRQLSTGASYDVQVRVVRDNDTFGPWALETAIEVSGDTTAPGVPTALSVTGTGTHTVGWTNPTNLDVMRGRVYANSVNNPATATEVAEVFGLPSTAYTATHTPLTTPTYYWVTAVDRSGNESARTTAGTGS